MTDVPPEPRPIPAWRARYDAARAKGVPLDPASEPVEGVTAYPTSYDRDHLLITVGGEDLKRTLKLLEQAAADYGWGVQLQNLDGTPLRRREATARIRRWRAEMDLPSIHRVQIFPAPRNDQPVPPIDAWRLLQRVRARSRNAKSLPWLSLDHVLTIDPIDGRTLPVTGRTLPVTGRTLPVTGRTLPVTGRTLGVGVETYLIPGTGGRQVVDYVGPAPHRTVEILPGGRRPVVAVLDTGCGEHPWLPDGIVTRYPKVEGVVLGINDLSTDPEVTGNVAGPYDGELDAAAGHGTFIAGIIRQLAPEADIISIRVADSQGELLESAYMMAIRALVKGMELPPEQGGRKIDVINLSLGYYHETPEDGLFDHTLSQILVAARTRGCAVVCSAGNDATDRPTFPAALWDWKDPEFAVASPEGAAPHVAVGALNPNGTMALFSNVGEWVTTYAPGTSVLSVSPPFRGGMQAAVRDDRYGWRRETVDPDDYSGGFALWSGTSFAAPYVAGMLARAITARLMAGEESDESRCTAMSDSALEAYAVLLRRGPRAGGEATDGT